LDPEGEPLKKSLNQKGNFERNGDDKKLHPKRLVFVSGGKGNIDREIDTEIKQGRYRLRQI
jgi:hypothetical protein